MIGKRRSSSTRTRIKIVDCLPACLPAHPPRRRVFDGPVDHHHRAVVQRPVVDGGDEVASLERPVPRGGRPGDLGVSGQLLEVSHLLAVIVVLLPCRSMAPPPTNSKNVSVQSTPPLAGTTSAVCRQGVKNTWSMLLASDSSCLLKES